MMGIEEPYAGMRNWSRAEIAKIWRTYLAGEPLRGEERILVDRLAAHPEWADWWVRADDLGDAKVMTPEGVNPFLRVSVEAAVEGMIGQDGEPAVRETHRQLLLDGLTDQEAKDEIARVFLGTLWTIGTGRVPPAEGDRFFHAALRRLAAGETAEEIFPEEG